MSVVVFDGFDLVGDSYLGGGSQLMHTPKVGKLDNFYYGIVGNLAVGQRVLRKLASLIDDDGRTNLAGLNAFDDWALELPERVAKDSYAELLVIPVAGDDMFSWYASDPLQRVPKQPIYLGANSGIELYNYCKAMNPGRPFARDCVSMCIQASGISNEPFALSPYHAFSVHPVEAV